MDWKVSLKLSDIDVAIGDMPDVVYKYRDFNNEFHQRLLYGQELYFASADQLNDPFDAAIPFQYKREQLTADNIFLKHCEMIKWANPKLSDTQIHEIAFENQKQGFIIDEHEQKKFQEKMKKDIKALYGIVSFSKIPNDLLMWSHYSNSHTGFCVGLDLRYIFKNFGPNYKHQTLCI